MKKDNYSILIRSSLALLVGATFLTPTHLLASNVALDDDGSALVETPAKAKKVLAANELRSLTNISSQLQEHAQRAEGRVKKLTELAAGAAQDIAEDHESIDFRALVKTAMPKGTKEALEDIYNAHERIAAAYELSTSEIILNAKLEKLEQEAEKTRQEMLRLKDQAGQSTDVQKAFEEQHKSQVKALEDQIAAVRKQKSEEVTAKVGEKQRELDEAKVEHQKTIAAITKERDDAKAQTATKQTELETANKDKAGIQITLENVTKQKDISEQKIGTLIKSLKALGQMFDGKDLKTVDEKTGREMLQAIHAKLIELAK